MFYLKRVIIITLFLVAQTLRATGPYRSSESIKSCMEYVLCVLNCVIIIIIITVFLLA